MSGCIVISISQVILIDDLADTCFTLLNAVTQLVRVGGAKNVHVFVTHAVMSQMPQDLFCCPELIRYEEEEEEKEKVVEGEINHID